MIHAISWSGGKDSTLALDRAVRQGLDVRYLFNIVYGPTGRVRFHGVRADLIARQAEALGLELIQPFTTPRGFEPAFLNGLDELIAHGVGGVVFGNIHLADVRAWYEERTTARGLEHVEPLWGDAPRDLVHEVLARGYRTRVVSVDLARGRRDWLGRELDAEFAAEIAMHPGVDPAGEQGEYHTFVFAGPLFRSEITYQIGEIHEEEGHVQVDVLPES
jgi:uncharacterized protein (TIGR00290 family)